MSIEDQPVSTVKWVDRGMLRANNWNPNHVAPPEMELLHRSLVEDGWTQPIVVQDTGDGYEIVDGYHRWTASADPEILTLTDGMVPVVVVALDDAHARMSTIRHNRARGTHAVLAMADIVATLARELDVSTGEIEERLGMESEEVNRLLDRGDVRKRIGRDTFSPAWRSAPKAKPEVAPQVREVESA